MGDEGPSDVISILMICEDNGHRDVARAIIDRCIAEVHRDVKLEEVRAWADPLPAAPEPRGFIKKSDIGKLHRELKLRAVPGRFVGGSSRERATEGLEEWRNALQIARELVKRGSRVDHVLLICDEDNAPVRHEGLKQAKAEHHALSGAIVSIGFPALEIEAWKLSGFVARDRKERDRLDEIRQELKLDPTTRSHELRHKKDHEPRSVKRVLWHLTERDDERERACYEETPLPHLAKNGEHNNLANFIERVRKVIVPSIKLPQPRPGGA